MAEAIVALGANLGDRWATLSRAIDELDRIGTVVSVSAAYESAPVGGPDQDDFLNAVAVVETRVDPVGFLTALHTIEADFGRTREVRWGPRTLDLDLIAHGDAVLDGDVVVPHPRAAERRFVLEPLIDCRPDFAFPGGRRADESLAAVQDQDVERVAGTGWWQATRAAEPLRLVVAGPGRAGGSLARAAEAAGHRVAGVVSRSGESAGLGAAVVDWNSDLPEADLVLLTVPDRALLATAATLASRIPPGAIVAHTSGITPISVLGPIADAGHPVGGLHPLAALPDPERGTAAIRGSGMAVGGSDPVTVDRLMAFARSLGAVPFEIDDEQRAGYHAAASVAANHLTTVLGAVEELATATGVPFEVYRPLVDGAVAHVFEAGASAALTGPVARRDEGTVRLQRLAVEASAPELVPLLDALTDATRRLAGRR